MLELTSATFDEYIQSEEKPVVVDFWAEWCGPCKKMAPAFTEVGEAMENLSFAKVDVDTNMDIASRYAVQSIPTLLVFSKGELVGRVVAPGHSAASIKGGIENLLAERGL